jgi:hypothetical protein
MPRPFFRLLDISLVNSTELLEEVLGASWNVSIVGTISEKI